MHPKHSEYNPKIFEQVDNNIASLSNNKTDNRATTPTKAILTQLCEKNNNKNKNKKTDALFKLYKELIPTFYSS